MAFIVKKTISGKDYYYLRESERIGSKVKAKTIAYLGKTRKEAEKKMKEILKTRETKKKEDRGIKGKMEDKEKKSKISIPEHKEISIEDMAVFCKRKGFVYASSEIYGGFSGFWDFGHLGVELNNNIKNEWWKFHVQERDDIVGIDGSIITNPKVWKASGHVNSFSDVLIYCEKCKKPNKFDRFEIEKEKNNKKILCQYCNSELNKKKAIELNMMMFTEVGPDPENSIKAYLRPETAQLIFANFKNVVENARMKLPFGIAQIGKAFRNEIAPRDFLFRAREFEQMELEYFIHPEKGKCPYEIPDVSMLVYSAEMQNKGKEPEKMSLKEALKKGIIKNDWHAYWLAQEFLFFTKLGANPEKFRIRQHKTDELAHYSTDCWDLEYKFPFGWKELEGIADRADYDLKQHEKFSGKDLKIFDEEGKKKILPHVVAEPSQGVGRVFLVFMFDAYCYDPVKAAIFPIVKNEKIISIAKEIYNDLKKEFNVLYDESASLGRRYSRADEIGIPFAITIDGDTLKNKDKDITIRNRDDTRQIRVKVKDLKEILRKLIEGEIEFEKAGKITETRVK